MQERPVLVEGRDVALARCERILDIPVERKPRAGFRQHERAEKASVPSPLLEDLVAGGERSEAANLAKQRGGQCAIQERDDFFGSVDATRDGSGSPHLSREKFQDAASELAPTLESEGDESVRFGVEGLLAARDRQPSRQAAQHDI